MSKAGIILCAGSSTRMGGDSDKLLADLGGVPLFLQSVVTFADCELFEHLIIVYRDDEQKERLAETFSDPDDYDGQLMIWVKGGSRRDESVRNALAALPEGTTHVFIHDAARPLVTEKSLKQLDEALETHPAATLAHRATDTTKLVSPGGTLKDLPREALWLMETPQAFEAELIKKAHARAEAEGIPLTDDISAITDTNFAPKIIESVSPNPKVTHPLDLELVRLLHYKHYSTPYSQ